MRNFVLPYEYWAFTSRYLNWNKRVKGVPVGWCMVGRSADAIDVGMWDIGLISVALDLSDVGSSNLGYLPYCGDISYGRIGLSFTPDLDDAERFQMIYLVACTRGYMQATRWHNFCNHSDLHRDRGRAIRSHRRGTNCEEERDFHCVTVNQNISIRELMTTPFEIDISCWKAHDQ